MLASRSSSSSRPPGRPSAFQSRDHVGDREDGLLAVPDDRRVEEVGDRLGVERRVAAGEHDRVGLVAVRGEQRDAGEVERREHVRVAQLGGERHPEDVERADRAVAVDRELRDGVLAHELLQVRPHRVGALGQGVGALVEDLVEDHDALVGQPDLVGVGVHQRPADGRVAGDVPVLHLAVQLTADVLDRLAHQRQEQLEPVEDATRRAWCDDPSGGHGAARARGENVRQGQPNPRVRVAAHAKQANAPVAARVRTTFQVTQRLSNAARSPTASSASLSGTLTMPVTASATT